MDAYGDYVCATAARSGSKCFWAELHIQSATGHYSGGTCQSGESPTCSATGNK